MDEEKIAERRRLTAEHARKQLATGTWPQVMAVFGYFNENTPRAPKEEFDNLKAHFETSQCPNMAAFVDQIRFNEVEHNATLSYNISLRRRDVENEKLTTENALAFLYCPDLLVGSRRSSGSAVKWLQNFTEVMSDVPSETIQVFDKIFGEACEILKSPMKETTVEEMIDFARTGKGELANPPKVSKH